MRKSIIPYASMIVVALTAACSEEQAAPAPPPPPAVTVTPVLKSEINPTYQFIGKTEAVDEVDLRARVQGILEDRAFEEGEDVEQGRLLFVIEQAPYQAAVDAAAADLASAKARLERAAKDRERAQELARGGNVSEQRLDEAVAEEQQARAEVEAAQADLVAARLDLQYATIEAPIGGRIGRSNYSVGSLVGPDSDVLATLVTLDPIFVIFNVSEQDYLDYQQRMEAVAARGEAAAELVPRIELANGGEYPLPGKIGFVDNKVDPTTGTIAIRAEFPNPDKLLLPGLFVNVLIEAIERRQALLVPQAAVQEDQAGRYVMVVTTDDKAERRRVQTGEQRDIYWEITDGLAEGERVIYQGIQKVRPGGTVAPTAGEPGEQIGSEPA